MDELTPLRGSMTGDPLARLLEHGAALEVDYDVEAGLARHCERVAAGPASAAGVRRGWWVVGGTVIAGLALAWIAARPSAPPPMRAATPVVAQTAAAIAVVTPVATVPPAPTSVMPEPTPVIARPAVASEPRPRRSSGARAVRTPSEPPAVDDAIAREAANVKEARRRLAAGDFTAAIAACDLGDREFAGGVLGVEREGLRILARLRRDGDEAAAGRARAYLAAHPAGPVSQQVRAAL